jgi:hypothetical protein
MCRRDHPALLRTSPRATALALLAVPSTQTVLAARCGALPAHRRRRNRGHGARCSFLIDEAGEVVGDDSELFVTLLLDTEDVGRPVRAMATVGTAQPKTSAHPTPPRSELVGRHQAYDQSKVTTCRKLPLQRTTPSKAPHRCRSGAPATADGGAVRCGHSGALPALRVGVGTRCSEDGSCGAVWPGRLPARRGRGAGSARVLELRPHRFRSLTSRFKPSGGAFDAPVEWWARISGG